MLKFAASASFICLYFQVLYNVRQLNKYKKKYYKKTQNLLTGKTEQTEEEQKKAEVMSFEVLNYWHPNITINLVDDQTAWQKGAVLSTFHSFKRICNLIEFAWISL